jgi:hypothetical protein
MKRSGYRRNGLSGYLLSILFATTLLLMGRQVWGARYGLSRTELKPNGEAGTLADSVGRQVGGQVGLGNFDLSLEAKENADFLLTPALLVQEALREDIIITYPME